MRMHAVACGGNHDMEGVGLRTESPLPGFIPG